MLGLSAGNWKLQLKIYRRFGVWGLSCGKLQRVRNVERFESSTWLFIGRWCNGSITVSNSVGTCSIRVRPDKII